MDNTSPPQGRCARLCNSATVVYTNAPATNTDTRAWPGIMQRAAVVSSDDDTLIFHEWQTDDPVYSAEQLREACNKAFDHKKHFDLHQYQGQEQALAVLRTLTSDIAWGRGRRHVVDLWFMADVQAFCLALFEQTEKSQALLDNPGVLHFVMANLHMVHQPVFAKLLRAYIFAYPATLNMSMDEEAVAEVGCTALHVACMREDIPCFVVKTLLEAGSLVDLANDNGDTALMMCVLNRSANSFCKLGCLLDYGASIDRFNLCFQGAIHLCVACANMEALRMLLRRRASLLRGSPPSSAHKKSLSLQPDPLHLPDEDHETPIHLLCRSRNLDYKLRIELLDMLVEAGSNADSDLDREARVAVARRLGGAGSLPPCWGLINCHLLGDFLIFFSVHKEAYSMHVTVDLDTLVLFTNKELSVLPPASMTEFSTRMLFIRCMKQQFDFAAGVDGIDMDVHFNVIDDDGFDTEVVGCNDGGAYKLAIRFPRGPCPMTFWTEQHVHYTDVVFESNIVVNKKYTLAHHAVSCECPIFRNRFTHMTKEMCNPLLKCARGLTATETLEHILVGRVLTWDVRRLLSGMRKKQDSMMQYVRAFAGNNIKTVANKAVKSGVSSPFHRLSDDVCLHILSFL
jgi:hypothetical protein